MQTKLHINISQGIIDVEGDPDLVREVYADFKVQLLSVAKTPAPPAATPASPAAAVEPPANDLGGKPKGKRRPVQRKRAGGGDGEGPTVLADSPKLDKSLDTSALVAFYGRFEAKNHPEKVLVFLKFLTDELGIESPNTDQVYTCYEQVDERIPKVFPQAFRDASGRKFGFIDYSSPTDIRVTIVGNNYFKFNLKKKKAEAAE